MSRLNFPNDLDKMKEDIKNRYSKDSIIISISNATCSRARGSLKIVKAFKDEEEKLRKHNIALKITGCHGFCAAEPNVLINPKGIFYQHLKPEDVPVIIEKTISGEIAKEFLFNDPVSGKKFQTLEEIPFYKKQLRLLLNSNLIILSLIHI